MLEFYRCLDLKEKKKSTGFAAKKAAETAAKNS
jgi:hypothetical protein